MFRQQRDEMFLTAYTINRGLLAIACILWVVAPPLAQATPPAETILHSFAGPAHGASSYASLARDSAGNLYGTASYGGTANMGIVFRLNPAGQGTVLHTFTGGADGAYPYAGVTLDSAGNLYGTARAGAAPASKCNFQGGKGCGVVFKIDTSGNFTVLYSFTGGADGGNPLSGVTLDSAGNLYGTTLNGGATGNGAVYEIPAGGSQTVLFSFPGGAGGGGPWAGVVLDSSGNLYGTALGGSGGNGVVYRLDPAGNETVLYTFSGNTGGFTPYGGVVRDSAGNLYGTTWDGGTGFGVVFKIDTSGNETVLSNLCCGVTSGVVLDAAGNLYGTTYEGGAQSAGNVFQVTPSGQTNYLYTFTGGADGGTAHGGVILDSAGNLYGVTYGGGVLGMGGLGVVYKVDPAGNETALYTLPGGPDGEQPYAGLTSDSSGNLYGTTYIGGSGNAGTVYKMDSAGNETVLYSFTGGADGNGPWAGVTLDTAGNLYGTTYAGGTAGFGVVYQVDPAGNQTVLYSFAGGKDGENPYGGVAFDSAGNLYGTTYQGGTSGAGTIFKLDTAGHHTVLHNFNSPNEARPRAGVILDANGNLYGTTSGANPLKQPGTVYKLDTSGNFTVLHQFKGRPTDGEQPIGGLALDAAGNLYGTTLGGGKNTHGGIVFRLNSAGQYKILYSFSGIHGTGPQAGVTIDSAGNLYGTTFQGGTKHKGVVYRVTPAGRETVLHSFTGGADGWEPYGIVALDSAGNLYGSTRYGGANSVGVVFQLSHVAAPAR